jgi:hypothetical protein
VGGEVISLTVPHTTARTVPEKRAGKTCQDVFRGNFFSEARNPVLRTLCIDGPPPLSRGAVPPWQLGTRLVHGTASARLGYGFGCREVFITGSRAKG